MKLFFRLFIVLIFLLSISCTKSEAVNNQPIAVQDSIPKNSKKIVSSIGKILLPKAKKLVSNWLDYQELDDLMTRYYAVSISDAYNNAEELVQLTRSIKDSIPIQKLQIDAVKVRFNVLYNEAMRLKDMSKITNVSKDELTAQIRRLIAAYSATNTKLNALVAVEGLEEKMKDFESAMLDELSAERARAIQNNIKKSHKTTQMLAKERLLKNKLAKKPFDIKKRKREIIK